MRVSDAATPSKREGIAFFVSDSRLDFDVVLLSLVHFLKNQGIQFAETALVGVNPGDAAVSLIVHGFPVAKGGGLEFFYDSIFGRIDDPAFLHEGGVIESGVVAGTAVFAEGTGEVGFFTEGGIVGGLCCKCECEKEKCCFKSHVD